MKGIDEKWFSARICAQYGSLRKFAREMRGRNGKPMTQSAFWRRLNGEYEFTLGEVAQLARLLNTNLMEIVWRLGVQSTPASGRSGYKSRPKKARRRKGAQA